VDHALFADLHRVIGPLAIVLLEEVLDEQRDVGAPLAQRRPDDGVAAIMRTSTLMVRSAPTGRISRSCSTRSSFTCKGGLISPTSSRKMVPPLASWNMPARAPIAPVKAPRSWPKISDSSSSAGIAPQLTGMNGRSPRCESV
jgi:hypothetical protein